LHPGLQHDPVALEALLSGRFVVGSRDRTGARLAGPPIHLARHDVRSQGVPWGAVQVPADGQPIVLLADRGRTGGYAVPAVVDPRDLWQLAQARPGSEVWFVPADAFR
jgi:allophanate hydrolase subunit 2